MTFPRYGSYKDSGVEWLNEVPSHWPLMRLRFMMSINPSKSEIANRDSTEEVSFLPMEAIGEDGSLCLDRTRPIRELETGYTYFRDGDVALAKITPCFENGKGAILKGLHGGIGFGTTELIVCRPRHKLTTAEFLHCLFTSTLFRRLGEAWMYGAGGQKRVPEAFVRNFRISLPPLLEQAAIIASLNRETDKIDALVSEQERLIELLKEKRRAAISHAVTKGLDSDVLLKESGVEWLGKVPGHWKVTIAKRVCQIFVPQRNKPELNSEGVGLPWVTMDLMGNKEVRIGDLFVSEKAASVSGSRTLPRGAVVASCVGTFGVASVNNHDVIINQQLQAFIPTDLVAPEFLRLCVVSAGSHFEMIGTAATVSYVNQAGFENFPIGLPPKAEQFRILDYLDHLSRRIDDLISESSTAITLLQERRSALISAAVTGKIDVRGLVAVEAEIAEAEAA